MAVPNKALIKPSASTFVLDDDVVLLAEGSGEIVLLNSTAGAIWQGLCDGLSPAEIAKTLASVSKRPQREVAGDCDALFAEWSKLGLVAGSDTPESPPRARRKSPEWWGDSAPASSPPAHFRPVITRSYRLNDFD